MESCFRENVGIGSRMFQSIKDFNRSLNTDKRTIRNIVKNLGTDNNDAFDAYKRNLKEAEYIKGADNRLAPNVVIKVNNNGVDEFYITRRTVNLGTRQPSRWVSRIDQNNNVIGLMENPDFAKIDVNVTLNPDGSLKTFIRQDVNGEQLYREARPDDAGERVFLNIQKPVKGHVDNERLLKENIDAAIIEKDGVIYYSPVSKNQIVKPSFADGDTSIRNIETEDYIYDALRSDEMRNNVRKSKNWLRQHGIIGPTAGAITASVGEYMLSDDDPTAIAPAIGMVLGSKRNRGRMRPIFNKITPTRKYTDAPPELDSMLQEDSLRRKLQEGTYLMGSGPDPRDAAEVTSFLDAYRFVRRSIDEAGDRMWDAVLESPYFQSGISKLERFSSLPAVKRLIEGLETMPVTRSMMHEQPKRYFSGELRSTFSPEYLDRNKDQVDALIKAGSGAYNQFYRTTGPSMVKRLYPDISDAEAYSVFSDSLTRMMMSGARLDETGSVVFRNSSDVAISNVQSVYNASPIAREVDQALLADEIVNKFVAANRRHFKSISDEVVSENMRRIDKLLDSNTFSDLEYNLLSTMSRTNRDIKFFKKDLSKEDVEVLDELIKRSPVAQDVVKYHKNILRMKEYDGAYLPQVFSARKLQTVRDNFYAKLRRENPEMTDADMTQQFERHMLDEFYDLNTDPQFRRKLLEYDEHGNFQEKTFRTRQDAMTELENIALSQEGNVRDTMLQNPEAFMKTIQRPKLRAGKPVTNENGVPLVEVQYYLESPENFRSEVFRLNNQAQVTSGFGTSNRGIYDTLLNGALSPRSNWLDMSRTRIIPFQFLETDFDIIMRRYNNDAARKIHNMRYDMMDAEELQNNYTKGLMRYVNETYSGDNRMTEMANRTMMRVNQIYNTSNGITGTTTEEMIRYNQFHKLADTVKNMFYMRLGWAMGFYNMFEYGVIAPLVGSHGQFRKAMKLYTTDKQALDNSINFLTGLDKATKNEAALGFANTDELVKTNSVMSRMQDVTALGADKVADFSFSKFAMEKIFRMDVNNLGYSRVFFDGFTGSNQVSSAINVRTALGEVMELGTIAREISEIDGAQRFIRKAGSTYTEGDVKRKLRLLGVKDDQQEFFMRNIESYKEALDELDVTGRASDFSNFAEKNKQMYDIFRSVAVQSTETFHGTNKLYRPESWSTPLGKSLSMYSSYPFNFALQHVKRRISDPIVDFTARYGMNADGTKRIDKNMLSIMWAFRNNDVTALKSYGFSDEAISNFPVGAYEHILKVFGSVGISVVGMMSIDTVRDLVSYPVRDARGEEQWLALNRYKTINPYAPADERMTWGDLDGEMGIKELMAATQFFAGHATRAGVTGRYGDLFQNRWMLQRQGPLALTPVTSEADKLFRSVMTVASEDFVDIPRNTAKELYTGAVNWLPVIGSGIFSTSRRAATEYMEQQFGYFGTDETTGQRVSGKNLYSFN
jgi:hypothetical protein